MTIASVLDGYLKQNYFRHICGRASFWLGWDIVVRDGLLLMQIGSALNIAASQIK